MSLLSSVKSWFRPGKEVPVTSHSLTLDLDIGPAFSSSGQVVNQDRSLSLDTVWACVRIISRTIGTLPLHLFKMDKNGFGTVDIENPLYRILHDKPCAPMTASRFWESATANLTLHGNHFSRIFRNANNEVSSLVPFQYQRLMQVEELVTGELLYTYTADRAEQFRAKDIFHLRGFTLDGKAGLSVIKYARQSFGNALAVAESTGRVFGNGLNAHGLITAKTDLTDEQVIQVHKRIEEHRKSKRNGVLVLPAQLEYTSLTMDPDDAQMLETRSFTVEEICRWFGVPPMLIGHMTKNTSWGSGIEQLNLFFLQYGLRAFLGSIEAEINNTLLTPEQKRDHYAKFNIEGLLRGDSKGRAEFLKNMVNGTLMTPNEGRAKEDLPPLEGGDQLIAPSNYVPLSMLGSVAVKNTPQAQKGTEDAE